MANPATSQPNPAALARWTDNQADALRSVAADRYAAETSKIGTERDSAARRQWAAEQEAKAADQQVKREQDLMNKANAEGTKAEEEAKALEAAGRTTEAEDRREYAVGARARAEASEARFSAAADAAVDARLAAREHGARVTTLDAELGVIKQRAHAAHDTAEALDQRAELYRQAAPHAAEADRLEALAAKARASGDDIVTPDIDRDAALARQKANDAVLKAEQVIVDRAAVIDVLGATQGAAMPTSIPEPSADLGSDPVLGDVGALAAVASPSSEVEPNPEPSPDDTAGADAGEPDEPAAVADPTDALTGDGTNGLAAVDDLAFGAGGEDAFTVDEPGPEPEAEAEPASLDG